jgi:hypothetical protein
LGGGRNCLRSGNRFADDGCDDWRRNGHWYRCGRRDCNDNRGNRNSGRRNCDRFSGHRSGNRDRGWRSGVLDRRFSDNHWRLDGANSCFASRWRNRRLDHHGHRRRRDGDRRAYRGDCTRRRLGDHRIGRGTVGNSRLRRRNIDNGRRLPRLGHDEPARFLPRLRRGICRMCSRRRDWRGHGPRGRGRRHRRTDVAHPRLLLFPLLVGQDCLQYIAGLGNIGEIDLGRNALGGTAERPAPVAGWPGSAVEIHANLLRLILFKRTRMSLSGAKAQLP